MKYRVFRTFKIKPRKIILLITTIINETPLHVNNE